MRGASAGARLARNPRLTALAPRCPSDNEGGARAWPESSAAALRLHEVTRTWLLHPDRDE